MNSANLGSQVLPIFPRGKKEAPNELSTQQAQSEHKGVALSPVCELWESFFHGQFWILKTCVVSGGNNHPHGEESPCVTN